MSLKDCEICNQLVEDNELNCKCGFCSRSLHMRCFLDSTFPGSLILYICNDCISRDGYRPLRLIKKNKKIKLKCKAKPKMQLMNLLLELGAYPLLLDTNKQLPLHRAVEVNNVEAMEVLLHTDCGPQMLTEKLHQNKTVMHFAAQCGSVDAIKNLIEHGAKIDVQDCIKQTPMLMAITSNNLPVAKYLKSIDYLNLDPTKTTDGRSMLHRAVWCGHIEIVEWLLEDGVPANMPDDRGWTPLHSAAALGNIKIAQVLLRHNASLSLNTNVGEDPLATAIKYNQRGMILFLKYQRLKTSTRT